MPASPQESHILLPLQGPFLLCCLRLLELKMLGKLSRVFVVGRLSSGVNPAACYPPNPAHIQKNGFINLTVKCVVNFMKLPYSVHTMSKTLALVASTLLTAYGLAESCAYLKNRLDPPVVEFVSSSSIEEARMYRVWTEHVHMTLPGYEIARRPPDISIEEMLNKEKAKQVIAQTSKQ